MNKTLAFAFVLAMTAAGIFGVKWQRTVAQMEADARKAARETKVVVQPSRPDPKLTQEIRRLENELRSLRGQMVNQREFAAEAHQREIEILMRENDSLQAMLSNRMNVASEVVSDTPVAAVEIIEPELVEEAEQDPIGITAVDMNEFRELNWRQGTMPAAGAAVIEIATGSPAMTAGIQVGDIILSVGRTVIDGPGLFNEIVSQLLPGSATQITLDRDRSEIVVMVLKPLE